MAKQIRKVSLGTVRDIDDAVRALKEARRLLRQAGTVKTLAKVRSALKSAEGARDQALRAASRQGGLTMVEALLSEAQQPRSAT
jgi:hypothetical protein